MKGEIKQRSAGSWQIRVYLGRDARGKRIRKSETVRGKKADAERRLRQILSELDWGIVPPERRYKLSEWMDVWIRDVVAPNRRQKTVDRYCSAIRLHIVPELGNVDIAKVVPSQVQALESKLLAGGMGPRGVHTIHNVLNGAMKHALRMELISRNPVALVSPPAVPETEAPSPDVGQVRALLAAAAESGHYLWPCVHLVAFTGLRRGEALAMMWENVDLEEKTLYVSASLVNTSGGVVLNPPKTASGRRMVDLDDSTVSVLRHHRKRQQELAAELGVDPPEMVFPRRDLTDWCCPNTLAHFVSVMAKKAGCNWVTLRSLRHFHASMALQRLGQNPVVVSKRMGHANVSITLNIYGHALPGWQRETAAAVAQAINAAP